MRSSCSCDLPWKWFHKDTDWSTWVPVETADIKQVQTWKEISCYACALPGVVLYSIVIDWTTKKLVWMTMQNYHNVTMYHIKPCYVSYLSLVYLVALSSRCFNDQYVQYAMYSISCKLGTDYITCVSSQPLNATIPPCIPIGNEHQ